jgi:hypothetical protein
LWPSSSIRRRRAKGADLGRSKIVTRSWVCPAEDVTP